MDIEESHTPEIKKIDSDRQLKKFIETPTTKNPRIYPKINRDSYVKKAYKHHMQEI